jgi:ferric iron reductase protein FhuF
VTLDEVLRAVAERVPYLQASTAIDEGDWVRSDALIADRATLTRIVRAAMIGFGADDEGIGASLFAESYAFRVAGVVLAAYALDLPAPSMDPATIAITVHQPRPAAVAYLDAEVSRRNAPELAHDVIGGHLAPFVAALHDEFSVGERLLWGNVAAACAVAFRAVESTLITGAVNDRAQVRDRAQAFVDACQLWFDGLGRFTVVEHDARQGWYWDRTSCCLWFRTADGDLCDNCSLIDPAELHEQRTRELASPDE